MLSPWVTIQGSRKLFQQAIAAYEATADRSELSAVIEDRDRLARGEAKSSPLPESA